MAVLTGNKTLARQMEAEGRALGVPVERFEGAGSSIPLPRRRKYRRAEAIGVMNYWVMFNQNPVIDSADLLIVDDAHLAEGALDSLYSVEVDRVAHPALFDTLVRALAEAFPDYATFQDAADGVPSRAGTELLSFLDQSAFVDRLRSTVDNAAATAAPAGPARRTTGSPVRCAPATRRLSECSRAAPARTDGRAVPYARGCGRRSPSPGARRTARPSPPPCRPAS